MDGVEQRLTFNRFGDHPDLSVRQDVADPFAVVLLLPAMLRGVPLVVEDTIAERLLLARRGPIQDTLRLLERRWRKVAVTAAARPSPTGGPTGRGGTTALSGGIDSMHLLRHTALTPDMPESLRIRLLMHHHVGAHGDDDEIFAEQFGHVRGIAQRLSLPLVGARCSLTAAYRNMPFISCVLMRNVAAAMTLDHLFDSFQYASSEPIGGHATIGPFDGIATLEPQLLPWFNTTRVTCFPFGGATTRLVKTAEVLAGDRLCGDLLVCIRGFRTPPVHARSGVSLSPVGAAGRRGRKAVLRACTQPVGVSRLAGLTALDPRHPHRPRRSPPDSRPSRTGTGQRSRHTALDA